MTVDRIRSTRRAVDHADRGGVALRSGGAERPFPGGLAAERCGTVARTLWASMLDGSMLGHAGATLYRVLSGFGLAVFIGLPLGVLMARFRPVENFVLPLMSALMPIPSLAWVPVFILWFGLGNAVTILIVFYAALFPMLLNTWTGVRSVNPIWLRAAGAWARTSGRCSGRSSSPARRRSSSPRCGRRSCARGSPSSAPKCWRGRIGGSAG